MGTRWVTQITTNLEVGEVVLTFREVMNGKKYLSALNRTMLLGGAHFEWDRPRSGDGGMFDRYMPESELPVEQLLVYLEGRSRTHLEWAIHFSVWDGIEGDDLRSVQCEVAAARISRGPAMKAVELYVDQIRSLDQSASVQRGTGKD